MAQSNISSPLIREEKFNSLFVLIKLTLNCGISGFSFGYFLTSFNAISFRDIVSIFQLQDYPRALTQGILTGSICFTGALGTILSRSLLSQYSRRHSLMILSCCVILLCLCSLIANAMMLFLSRLGQGLAIGCISCLTPLYMREMMPKEVSGPLWSVHQVLYVGGISFSFVLVFILGHFMEPEESWRIVFGFPIILCLIQLINFTYFYRFDTPKWYVLQGDNAKAEAAINFIYKPEYVTQILKQTIDAHKYSLKKNITKIQENQPYIAEVEMDMLEADGKIKEHIQPPKVDNKNDATNNPLAIFAGFFVIGQQQLLGGVAVVQYAGQRFKVKHFKKLVQFSATYNLIVFLSIFKFFFGKFNKFCICNLSNLCQHCKTHYLQILMKNGTSILFRKIPNAGEMTLKTFPNLQTTFPAIINLVSLTGAIVSIQILRRWGRKQLLTYGAYVAMASLLVITLIFWKYDYISVEQNSFVLRVILLIGFLVVRFDLASVMGPVPWLYVAETLQPNLVPLCYLFNWLMLGTVSIAFPLICEANGDNPSLVFFLFFIVALAACFVNPKVMVQTKGKSQLQIRKQYDSLWK